eukprot:NODE_10_length_61504_cov_0.956502.p35 type:complete len:204 gc:universal NODE_10_length_61504_cov_0.956502:7508-6897(-)
MIFNFCLSSSAQEDRLNLSYLIDRILLLSRDVNLANIPWIPQNDKSINFVKEHVRQIHKNNLHILSISNCEVLLFIIREWKYKPVLTKEMLHELLKKRKQIGFELSFQILLESMKLKEIEYLHLCLRLFKRLALSEYQSELFHLVLPSMAGGEIVNLMIEFISCVGRILYPSKYLAEVPKIMLNDQSIIMSSSFRTVEVSERL